MRRRERFYFAGAAILAVAIVFLGFARTYYLRALFGGPPLAALLHLHGLVFSLWLVLLLSQIALVAVKRTDLHRRLGVAGGLLAALMIVVGGFTAVDAARRGASLPGSNSLGFLAIALTDLLVFAILVAAALYYRRQSDTHKRLMLLATISILAPATSRFPFAFVETHGALAFFGLVDLVLVACILYDVASRRSLHPCMSGEAY